MFPTNTKILVLDDMPTIRDLVRNQLKDLGYKNVVTGEDGDEGLRILQDGIANGDPVGLVISDWNMPRMKGLDLLKAVRAHAKFNKLPFILLTSEAERDQVTEAVLAGVSQYIIKPFTPKGFEEKIKAVWTKHNGK